MPEVRLFIAVELPAEPVLAALSRLQERLRGLESANAIRWTASSGIHLTLKFLGETPADRVDRIAQAMHEAAQAHHAFDLSIRGVGGFPDLRRPRVVWAGLHGDLESLHALRDSVERTVSPLGYPTESRPFSPHLTLGRARQDASTSALGKIGGALAKLDVGEIGAWRVTGVSLMESDLRPSGAVYTQRAWADLIAP